MNTRKSLSVRLALFTALATVAQTCAASPSWLPATLGAGATAQLGKSKASSDKQQAEKLMTDARAALKQGEFDTAEGLLAEVEAMHVEFGVLHFGDTPRKLRADLAAAQRKQGTKRPSSKFKAELPADQVEPPKKPATAPRSISEVRDPGQEQPLVMPQSEGRLKPLQGPLSTSPAEVADRLGKTPMPGPLKNTPPAESTAAAERATAERGPVGSEARRESDTHLLAARRALAVGDVRRASTSLEAARKLNVSYGYHDDTPDKVDGAIRAYQHVAEASAGKQDESSKRQLADVLMDQAQQLMRWKEYDEAERLVQHVKSLRINYGPFDVKPEALSERIAVARRGGAAPGETVGAVRAGGPAAGNTAAGGKPGVDAGAAKRGQYPAAQAVYDARRDPTKNRTASGQEPVEAPVEGPVEQLPPAAENAQPIAGGGSEAQRLLGLGEQAMRNRDMQQARDHFTRAYELRDQLDASSAQRLQDHLQLLAAPAPKVGQPELLMDSAASKQTLLYKQVSNDLAKKGLAADKIREKEPKRAMEMLKEARAAVEASGVEPDQRSELLRRADRKIAELDKYLVANRAQIELDETNKEIMKEVDRRLDGRLEIDSKLAVLVDDYNRLMDEERFAEAEVLAKRARELDPDNPLVKQLIWQNKFVSRTTRNQSIKDQKEQGFIDAQNSLDISAVPFNDNEPYQHGDVKDWKELTKNRMGKLAERGRRRTEREAEIERKLKTPVSLKFRERPLAEVLEHLAKLAAVNLHLDPKGLEEEGVSSDTSVTIDLPQDISLKSALNLLLEPLHLSYVIKDEVLKITSEQLRDGEVITQTYDVADLVIPIPNFSPNGRVGMAGSIAEAYNMTGTGVGLSPGTAFVASPTGANATGVIDPAIMAQMQQLMPGGNTPMASGLNQPSSFGPGGMGGGAQADFDSLIELITTTVKPQTWDEVGGPGSISEFRNNLSLVISQTEDVHEEIVDLLEQLRRNQDLQVTIEVRFITLADNFFEQIGVDFDFNVVNTSATVNPFPDQPPRIKREIVGLQPTVAGRPNPNFTDDLSIPFTQDSFTLAVPQFGQPTNVASFGFAILSDLEAFLLVNASQGDRRSNVLQAPKVTLFNGQQASVFDQTQQPFVISVIPVVGDFAAAYQPVITVLSQGTALTVQAVISHDRRFVRLTVLPFFSQIGDVQEFTFSGSQTTTDRSSSDDSSGGSSGDRNASSDETETTKDGVTIQLPNFSFVSVTTTVSVPDGGTVLLGGIKRLSEGRNEFGVPILSKLPYINRLFKNVGIGRETQSLMMMVTPRIIIQEEEEQRLGIQTPP